MQCITKVQGRIKLQESVNHNSIGYTLRYLSSAYSAIYSSSCSYTTLGITSCSSALTVGTTASLLSVPVTRFASRQFQVINMSTQSSEKLTCDSFAPIKRTVKNPEEWKKKLPAHNYHITREAGTERPFTGEYWNNHEKGIYNCFCCSTPLFDSATKFESGTGWPSFYDFIKGGVKENVDRSFFMVRREVVCSNCDAHLGHVFDDGPRKTTGLRYCINSASLKFQPSADKSKHDNVIVDTDNVCAIKK